MYDAKEKGGGGIYRVFDQASMGSRSSARLRIEADLRKGLERGELEVYYQPFYSLDEERIVGAEGQLAGLRMLGCPVAQGSISRSRFGPASSASC